MKSPNDATYKSWMNFKKDTSMSCSSIKNKYDLGLAKNYMHQIHLKDNNPIFRKQFKRPVHHQYIEQTLEEWLKLRVVWRSDSLFNSPIFCVPKKQGQGLQIMQDFQELNQNSHINKYSMKELTECIGDFGGANS
jgi:hypothetical protein